MVHNLLARLFDRRGIEDVSQLSEEEQATYKTWESILGKDTVTLKDFEEFCNVQLDMIASKLHVIDIPDEQMKRLVLLQNVYTTMKNFISKPRQERVALEEYLNNLLSTPKS